VNRYLRQITLPEFGTEGQRKLNNSSILIIGAGGLGSPASLYLAAAGVGRLGLVDFDRVDVTNLHRQILYGTSDVGRAKLESATERLRDANPEIVIETHAVRLTSKNALEILANYDVILDGTDNFATRYLVNDACVLLGKPNVYGSIFRFEGQASVFFAKEGPCYRCLYPEPPPPDLVPSCAEGGVLGVLPGVVGTIQATEAIKLLVHAGETLIGRLLLFDALRMSFRQMRLRKDPNCVICGEHPTITKLIDYEQFCNPATAIEVTAAQLASLDAALIDVREPYEFAGGAIEGATLIPLGALPSRLDDVPRDRDVVVYCHSGARSARAVEILRGAGFQRARHLRGGYVAWLRER